MEEKEVIKKLIDFLEKNESVTDTEIDLAIDCMRKHPSNKEARRLKKDLKKRMVDRTVEVINFMSVLNSNNNELIKTTLAYYYLPFKDADILTERMVFKKIFNINEMQKKYVSLILGFLNLANKVTDESISNLISFIKKEKLDYNILANPRIQNLLVPSSYPIEQELTNNWFHNCKERAELLTYYDEIERKDSKTVIWVAKDICKNLGYDVISVNEDGSVKPIIVKATLDINQTNELELTSKEWKTFKNNHSYIYNYNLHLDGNFELKKLVYISGNIIDEEGNIYYDISKTNVKNKNNKVLKKVC